jgi:hypothetical protein
MRAISLFEFEVSLFFGSFSKRPHKNARLFAAIKLMEHLEQEMKMTQSTSNLSLKDLASNDEYCRIFDEVIGPTGGWLRIRRMLKVKEFDADICARIDEAKAVAKVIDFSYRFANLRNHKGYKGRGGVSLARYVVRTAPSYYSKSSRSTMNTRWRNYGPASAFIYLLLENGYSFRPRRVATKQFAARLLQQTQDEQALRQFFCAYQHITKVLSASGYTFPKLSLNLGSSFPPIVITPFSEDVETAIKSSSRANID